MIYASIIFLFLFLSPLLVEAKTPPEAIITFEQDTLPSLQNWFSKVEISEGEHLRLHSTESFLRLKEKKQVPIMTDVLLGWQDALKLKEVPFVEVLEPTGGSLWRLGQLKIYSSQLFGPPEEREEDIAELIDRWNLNDPLRFLVSPGRPWFMFLGCQMPITETTIGLSGNLRLGTFLLKNRLDTALTVNYDMSMLTDVPEGTEVEPTISSSFGLMGRIHFPLRKYEGVTWNVGGQILLQKSGDTSSTNFTFVAGVSKCLGQGSVDLSLNLGKDLSQLSLGYTTFFGRSQPRKKKIEQKVEEEIPTEEKIEQKVTQEAPKEEVPKGEVYCGKCGTKNPVTAKFCAKCGNKLKK